MSQDAMEKLRGIIEGKVRPALNAHGGDIELLDVTEEGYAKVKLTGACATCPGAQQTLAEVVEVALKEAAPEIKGVIPVSQVGEDLIRQALAIIRKDKG